jgi:acyl-CoA synthetase (AMP-forming)/AMP-acid ligase II
VGRKSPAVPANPEGTAIFAPGRAALTFRALCHQLDPNLGTLNSVPIRCGDRVALVLPNGPELLTAFLAVACRAEAAPLNPALSSAEFDRVEDQSRDHVCHDTIGRS